MMSPFPSTWQRYFAEPAVPVPTAEPPRAVQPVSWLESLLAAPSSPTWPPLGSAPTRRPADKTCVGSAAPPVPPRPPVDRRRRPTPPKQPRHSLELAWLTCQMPKWMREQAAENLRQTLDWRAQRSKPLKAPKKLLAITRFGLRGEELWPKGAGTIRRKLKMEARESVRLVEGTQPHLERNHLLAMRGARLGQLCADLEERGLDALEILRCELTWLWN